ncbi:MAG TPA: FadR/GntR family transcriptional regulator [Gaiellaceae bacterium]|nr:FadR/GntR family transcriptional regulator [Gaiellaceae bacterium]
MEATRLSARERPARFASVVVEELANEIVRGTFAEGEVLPTEPVMCEQFGFSRTVIREALKMLEERGLVRVEQGRGTTVQPRDMWNLLDPLVLRIALAYDHDMTLLDDLVAVRRLLEREMAEAAADRLTKEELAELDQTLRDMERSYDDYERFRRFDQRFHALVMKASGNEVGLTIVRVIHRHGDVTPPLASGASRATLERTTREHRGIYEALAAGDGVLAGDRIAAHIESAWAERRRKGRRKKS